MTPIKRCERCNGVPVVRREQKFKYEVTYVVCPECGAKTMYCCSESLATSEWNKGRIIV